MTSPASSELTQAPFSEQLESIFDTTNLQLIGSIGRRLILKSYDMDKDPLTAHRPNGEFRDIDALDHMNSDQSILSHGITGPLKLDLEGNKWVRREANGIWITFPGDTSIAEEVRPEVFIPVVRRLGDLGYRTYSASTQQRLNRFVFERPKDRTAFRAYDNFVDQLSNNISIAKGDIPLPREYYTPFTKFCQAVREKHKGYFWACRMGVVINCLPPGLRNRAKRIGHPVRRRYLP